MDFDPKAGDTTRPLVRWTIGPVSPEGRECLAESVRRWRCAYGGRLDMVVCHNGVADPCAIPAWLADLGVPLYAQRGDELAGMPRPPHPASGAAYRSATCVAWKLYPPRLRPDAHEIFLDSDCVVTRPLRVIEEFLDARDVVLTSPPVPFGVPGSFACYGRLAHLGHGEALGSHLFGLCPGFDLGARLPFAAIEHRWDNYLDEQGLVGVALQDGRRASIPRREISHDRRDGVGRAVMHFAGLNYLLPGKRAYWRAYLAARRAGVGGGVR